ncbi:hypothetical protein LINPERHAP2_LOCUS22723 [Linum perenne]
MTMILGGSGGRERESSKVVAVERERVPRFLEAASAAGSLVGGCWDRRGRRWIGLSLSRSSGAFLHSRKDDYWEFRYSSISPLLELRLTNRQDQRNHNDKTNVLGQNSESSFRLSLSFQLEVVDELSLEQQLG